MDKIFKFIVNEFREILPTAVFFLITFHMLTLTKTVVLEDQGLSVTRTATATIGALIVAKAILVVELLPIAKLFANRMMHNIFWKTLLFTFTATLFQLLEELIPRIYHNQEIAMEITSISEDIHWPHFLVIQMWLFSLLFLYCFMSDIFRAVGRERVRELLLGPLIERPKHPGGSTGIGDQKQWD